MCTGAEIALVAGVAATGVQAGSTLKAGKAEQEALQAAGQAEQEAALARSKALEHQAAQGRQQAGQERATAQRSASEQRRQGRLLASRALARAAASGAGAGDPTVENIIGDIGAEGEFRALSEMFIGEERALGLETQADLRIFEAGQERRAGAIARRAGVRAGAAARSASRGTAFAQILGGAATVAGSDVFKKKKKTTETTGGSGQGLARFG